MRFQDSIIRSIFSPRRNFVLLLCLLIQLLIGPVEASSWSQLLIYSPWVEGDIDRFDALTKEEKEMVREAKPLLPYNSNLAIFKENNEYFIQPKCGLNWYKWDGKKWNSIFYSPNRGAFCSSYSFIKENDFFVLGKYGFWEGHFDFIKISKNEDQPTWVDTKNQPLNFQALGAFQTKNGIISLFGFRHNPRLNLAEMDYNGYFLDWENKSWKEISFHWDKAFEAKWKKIGLNRFPHFFSFESEDYGIIFLENFPVASTGWYIIDKNTLEVFFSESHVFLFQIPFTVLLGDENDFWLSASNLGGFSYLKVSDLLDKSELVGRLKIKELGFFDVDQELLVDLTLLLGVLVVGFVWYWQSKTKEKEVGAEVSDKNLPAISVELENVLPELHAKAGQLLKQQELDVLLGIHEIKNLDLKKVKRARLIRLINEETLRIFGNPCIERVRSEEDRRMMQYRIDPIFTSNKDLVSPG